MKKILQTLCGLTLALAFFACSDGSSSGGGTPKSDPDAKTQNSDGTTTLKIQENAAGFVSSTGSVKDEYKGYKGSGYLDGLIDGGNIVYTISAAQDISDAKIALNYCCTEVSRIRGALVSVNGVVINENAPLAMTYTFKGNKTDATEETAAKRWQNTAYLENVALKAGSNSVIISGAPSGTYTATGGASITIESGNSGCLNYVDYLVVNGKGIDYGTDSTPYYSFSASTENASAGSVSYDAASVKEGSVIVLTAAANSNWTFECWSDGSKENPYNYTVSKNTILSAHFIPEGAAMPAGLVGYASITSDSADSYTITGGAGAPDSNIVTITTYDQLLTTYSVLLSSDLPKIIKISGVISTAGQENPLYSVKVNIGSNTTLYGDPSNQGRLRNIGVIIKGENVIVRNMIFGEVVSWDGYKKSGADDAFSLNCATHVWVDHCEFQSHLTPQDLDGNEIKSSNPYYSDDEDWAKDFYDGLLDVKNGSSWITVSNCYFHDHHKACLCASGDDGPDTNTRTGATDSDMRVTFYNNYWYNISARQPLFRYGKGHIYSSWFDAGSTEATCINVRAGSELYIEGNYFKGMKSDSYTIGFYYADSEKKYGNVSGTWVSKNNYNVSTKSGTSYKPPYSYTAPSSYPASAPVPGTDVGVGILSESDIR